MWNKVSGVMKYLQEVEVISERIVRLNRLQNLANYKPGKKIILSQVISGLYTRNWDATVYPRGT